MRLTLTRQGQRLEQPDVCGAACECSADAAVPRWVRGLGAAHGAGGKIRVGIISLYLKDHPAGKSFQVRCDGHGSLPLQFISLLSSDFHVVVFDIIGSILMPISLLLSVEQSLTVSPRRTILSLCASAPAPISTSLACVCLITKARDSAEGTGAGGDARACCGM